MQETPKALLPSERSLAANAEFLKDRFVTFWAGIFQIRQKPTPLGHHDQQTSSRGMVLLVRLEMLRKLGETFAQQSNLNFRRSGVGLMGLIPCENLPFRFDRQCHSRGVAPCLLFISFGYAFRIPHMRNLWQGLRVSGLRQNRV